MAYTQPTEETIQGIEGLGLSPDQEMSLIDFIETTIGADDAVETEEFSAEDDTPVVISDDVEQVIITSGGTYVLPDENVLVIIRTDEPVTVFGDPTNEHRAAVIGADGNDSVLLDGIPPGLEPAPAATDDTPPPGSGYVLGRTGDDTIHGTDGDDEVDGGGGADVIETGAGSDLIHAGEGPDTIDGGAGFDVVDYKTVARVEVDITFADGVLQIDHPAGEGGVVHTDTIVGVEYVGFTDGGPELVLETTTDADIARLYEVLVNRAADAPGLEFWLWASDQGLSTEELATYMIGSEEFQSQLPEDPTASDIVEVMYNYGLDRESDDDGLTFWTGLVEDGSLSVEEVAVYFASCDEAVDLYDYIHVLPEEPDMMV